MLKKSPSHPILSRQDAAKPVPNWFWPSIERGRRGNPTHHRARMMRMVRFLRLRRLRRRFIETKSAPRWRWPNFTPAEMACRHCGEAHHWPDFMDALQAARDRVGRPFRILSAHRCALHNARVGGAPRSEHLSLAVDIALRGHDPGALHRALREAGFTGFGFYTTF
ncbi:MAG: D-Ala-D-Ala carboxypeptidase family metallohydrolase, partial [Litorimonas sp.]